MAWFLTGSLAVKSVKTLNDRFVNSETAVKCVSWVSLWWLLILIDILYLIIIVCQFLNIRNDVKISRVKYEIAH